MASILSIRLIRPELPNDYVRDRAIVDRMVSVVTQQRLTFLHAPAGYGKTMAMAEMGERLKQRGHDVAWLTLDSFVANPDSFWTHLTTALQISEGVPPGENRAVALSGRLFQNGPRNDRFVFVDCFEEIASAQLTDEFLWFCSLTPPDLHFVIGTRTLSGEAKAAAFQLGERVVAAEDMELTADETACVLEALCGEAPSEALCAELHAKTRGWVRGVRLAGQALLRSASLGSPLQFDGGNLVVREFFSGQIMARLPPELHSFLVRISLFERFSRNLLAIAFPDEDANGLLDELLRLNLLVSSCDGEGAWYHLHPLFADFLHQELLESDIVDIRRVCLVASEWFHNMGFQNESAKYLSMSGDIAYLEGLAEAVSGLTRPNRQVDPLLWMCRLRSDEIPASPFLCIMAAWTCVTMARLHDASTWIRAFEQALERPENATLLPVGLAEFSAKCLHMKHHAMMGEGEQALALCEELQNGDQPINSSLLSMINQSEAEAYESVGDYEQAMEHYLKAQASASVDRTVHQLFFNEYTYAVVQYYYGEHAKARQGCESLIAKCPPDFAIYGAACALLARVLIEIDAADAVPVLLEEAERGITPYRHIDLYLETKMAGSIWLLAQGRVSQAFETITEAVLRGEQYENIPRMALLSAYYLQAQIAMRQGNLKELKIIEQKYLLRLREGDLFNELLLESIQAYVLMLEGDQRHALAKLDGMILTALDHHFNRMAVNSLVDRTLLLSAMGETSRAMVSLNELIRIAHRQGYIRTVLNAGAPMRHILRDFSTSRKAGGAVRTYVKSLLLRFGNEPDARSGELDEQVGLLQSDYLLTAREVEVLKLLNMGMSRKEIAETLSISINTAKKHLSNIYAKMGANTREEVLENIARETA